MLKTTRTAMDAEAIAIAALGFIAADPERLGRFLSLTGIGPETLRSAARNPGFLARVLEHVSEDDALLLAFAANAGHAPETIAAACKALSERDG